MPNFVSISKDLNISPIDAEQVAYIQIYRAQSEEGKKNFITVRMKDASHTEYDCERVDDINEIVRKITAVGVTLLAPPLKAGQAPAIYMTPDSVMWLEASRPKDGRQALAFGIKNSLGPGFVNLSEDVDAEDVQKMISALNASKGQPMLKYAADQAFAIYHYPRNDSCSTWPGEFYIDASQIVGIKADLTKDPDNKYMLEILFSDRNDLYLFLPNLIELSMAFGRDFALKRRDTVGVINHARNIARDLASNANLTEFVSAESMSLGNGESIFLLKPQTMNIYKTERNGHFYNVFTRPEHGFEDTIFYVSTDCWVSYEDEQKRNADFEKYSKLCNNKTLLVKKKGFGPKA